MLVYANHFEITGKDRENKVFQTIKGWLKGITKLDLSTNDLKSGNDFCDKSKYYFIRTIKDDDSKLYSVSLSHYDVEIKGREWKTEIGVKNDTDILFISLKVETIEQSTLVNIQPQSTRPKLINFLQQNCNFNLNTIGSSHFNVDNFNDFKNIVFDPNRDYPIVLVSCMNDSGLSFVDCEKLQEHLFGLAQVYFL